MPTPVELCIREEEEPAWLEYLTMNVKADVRQALNFIALNEHLIFQH